MIHATPAMHQEAQLLADHAAVAWLDRDVRASKEDIAAAIVKELGTLIEDVHVVRHYPEAFLVRFFHKHHCALATSQHELPFNGTKLQLRPWRLEAHADNVDLVHHVRLCLDGLPLQAWDEFAVAQAIGLGCSIDYIEPVSKIKADTEMLGVWAWTASPANGPRVNWITLPALTGGQPAFGRRGLERRVIIHLAIHEDPTQGPRLVSKGYTFRKDIVDRESKPRDPREHIFRPADHHRCDSDDDQDRRRDDDSDHRGHDSSRNHTSWGDRIRRSLSRQPRDTSRDQGRRDDRREDLGRRRHDGSAPTPALPTASPAVLLGSRSASAEDARALELQPV